MTPLRQKMLNDMIVRGFAKNTQKSYLRSVTDLAKYYRRSPDHLTPNEIQQYLIYLNQERHLGWKSCNTARHGLRFFYCVTLGWSTIYLYLPCAKEPSRLPEVLSREEIQRLLTVTTNRKQRTLLMTTYATGLRVSEVTRLKVSDIDSQRMCIRVEQGKNQKDRYVPLSPNLLAHLRDYWRRYRPPLWLFPGPWAERPMSRSGATGIFYEAKAKAGIQKKGGLHVLRHCFGTHLLEAGTELVVIQRLMGHTSIRSTMRYLHIAQEQTGTTPSPFDLLEFPNPPHR